MKVFLHSKKPPSDYQDRLCARSQWFGETLRCTREEAEKNRFSWGWGELWRSDVTAVTSGLIKSFQTADWFEIDISSVSHVLQAKNPLLCLSALTMSVSLGWIDLNIGFNWYSQFIFCLTDTCRRVFFQQCEDSNSFYSSHKLSVFDCTGWISSNEFICEPEGEHNHTSERL